MSIDFKIDNAALSAALKEFPQNIQKNVLDGAVRAGANVIVQAAKENVPKKTRNLEKSIGINKRRTKDKSFSWSTVSPRRGGRNDGFYGHMVEYGTSKSAANPFMRTAFDSHNQESIEAARAYIASRIDKEVEKARR